LGVHMVGTMRSSEQDQRIFTGGWSFLQAGPVRDSIGRALTCYSSETDHERHALRRASFFRSRCGPGLRPRRMIGTRKFLALGRALFRFSFFLRMPILLVFRASLV
jgi:hypothetical protein